MRILHTSDWHLGRYLEQISRIDEQREFIDCLCRVVEEQKIDLVLIAGDVYDTYNPSAAAEELFYDALDRLNAKGSRAVVVIAGNHDNPERLCAASPLAFRNGIVLLGYPGSDAGVYRNSNEKIRITDAGPGWLEMQLEGCDHNAVILTLPYPSEARLEEALVQEADESGLQKAYSEKIGSVFTRLSEKFREDTVNLGVGHLLLMGGKESESERTLQVGGALAIHPSVLPEKAHFIALGHLHRPQCIRSAPCPAYYSGSPLAYSFSEADYKKCVYIIDAIPGKEPEITEYSLECGKPLCRWKAEEGIGQAFAWCRDGRDANGWIDLEIWTDRVLTQEEQRSLRELHPGIINIRPVIRDGASGEISSESREGRKLDQLFKDFYKSRTGTEISEELMTVFVDIINNAAEIEHNNAVETGCSNTIETESEMNNRESEGGSVGYETENS